MSTIIRRFYWSDPDKGWGDAGTAGFYLLPVDFPKKRYGYGEKNPIREYFYEHVAKYSMACGIEVLSVEQLQFYSAELSRERMKLEKQHTQVLEILGKVVGNIRRTK